MKNMKLHATKCSNGKFKLSLVIPPIELPVEYSENDLKTLEQNSVLMGKDSYNGGTLLKFTLMKESQEKVTTAILDAVTER